MALTNQELAVLTRFGFSEQDYYTLLSIESMLWGTVIEDTTIAESNVCCNAAEALYEVRKMLNNLMNKATEKGGM